MIKLSFINIYSASRPVLITLHILSDFRKKIRYHNTLFLKTLCGFLVRLKSILCAPPFDVAPTITALLSTAFPRAPHVPTTLASFSSFQPSHAQCPLQGRPAASLGLPQVLPWSLPSPYSASSSDVTFSETSARAKVAQPSPITSASHHPIFQISFQYLLLSEKKKKKSSLFIFLFIVFPNENGSSLRSGTVLLTAAPRSVFDKYVSRSLIFTTTQQARHHCSHLPDEVKSGKLEEVNSAAQGHPTGSDVTKVCQAPKPRF